MGLIGKLLSFTRAPRRGAQISDAKFDPGGGAVRTSEHFGSPGDDAHPMPGDYVATVATPQTGGQTAVGYLDPKNPPVAQTGEKRIYARDSAGDLIVEIHLKADGEATILNAGGSFTMTLDGQIEGTNGAGYFRLGADGIFTVNGATVDTGGVITSPSQMVSPLMTVAGKELAGHNHNINGGSSAPGPTGPNN